MSDPGNDDAFGPDEAFEEPPRGMSAGAKMAVVAAVVVGLGAAGGIAWFAYQQGLQQAGVEPVPMIKAEEQRIKEKPEEPGGMDVPHQDKLVFNRLAPGQSDEPIERLLPPPEAPVAKPEPTAPETPPADGQAATAPADERQTDGPAVASAPRDAVTVDPPPVPQAPGTAAEEPAPAEETASQPETAAESADAPTPPEPAATTETAAARPSEPAAQPARPSGPAWRVQLAAVSKREAADAEWARMKQRNDDLLGDLDLNVNVANLSKGTFYRIQAGPLADRSSAEDLCAKLKSRKQDCLVVAP